MMESIIVSAKRLQVAMWLAFSVDRFFPKRFIDLGFYVIPHKSDSYFSFVVYQKTNDSSGLDDQNTWIMEYKIDRSDTRFNSVNVDKYAQYFAYEWSNILYELDKKFIYEPEQKKAE